MFYGWQHFSAIEFGYKVDAGATVRSAPHRQNGPEAWSGCSPARTSRPRK
jgi:hypothetical protein